jgi:prepilin-type processing-associated H-X9-DG protein
MVLIVIPLIVMSLLPLAISLSQRRDKQIKDLSNARRIAFALKDFAVDHDGDFPNKEPATDYERAEELTTSNKSNDAFWWLSPTYVTSEDIFTVPGSAWSPSPPDNQLDQLGSVQRRNTLRQGECAYLYVTGLNETSNREFPLLADAGTVEDVTVYTNKRNAKGGIWHGKKAIILFVDGSGRIMDVDDRTDPAAAFVRRAGHAYNIFDTNASTSDDPWLTSANFVLPPE